MSFRFAPYVSVKYFICVVIIYSTQNIFKNMKKKTLFKIAMLFLVFATGSLLQSVAGNGRAPLDLGITSLDLAKFISSENGPVTVSGKVKNFGTITVNSFRISYQIDNETPVHTDITGVTMGANSEITFTCTQPFEPVIGNRKIRVTVSLPNGEQDQNPQNDEILHEFLVFDGIIGRTRTMLFEGFTSSSCVPCVEGNTNLKKLLSDYHKPYTLIKYQMSFPGNGDPYYTAEGGVRRTLYGITGVPRIFINGAFGMSTVYVTESHLLNLEDPAYMDLDVHFYVTGKTVHAMAKVNPTINFLGEDLRLFLAIVEKETKKNTGSNGEKTFDMVMKKFMPDANGIPLNNLFAYIPSVITQSWEFKGEYRLPPNANSPINHNIEHSIEDFNNLTIVAWVQNMKDLQAAQATYGIDSKQTVVTFGSAPHGTISATVNGSPINSGAALKQGDVITFTATPDEEYIVREWRVNGQTVAGENSDVLTKTFDNQFMDVTVIFRSDKANYYYVNYNALNEFGTLTATVDGEVVDPEELVIEDSNVVFTATPNDRYAVKEWRLNGEPISGNTSNELIVPMLNEDVHVTVEFWIGFFNMKFNKVNNGGILTAKIQGAEVESDILVKRGSRILFTAIPYSGCSVKKWINNGTVIPGNTTYEYLIPSLNNDVDISVEFSGVGIDEHSLSKVKLFPNPFTNGFVIKNAENVIAITLTNYFGQTVKKLTSAGAATIHIDAKELPAGIYMVTLTAANNERTTTQIIKN